MKTPKTTIKRSYLLPILLLVLTAATFSSCSDDPDDPYVYPLDFDQGKLQYNADGVWDKAYSDAELYIRPYFFNHMGSPDYGGYFSGFAASKCNDKNYYPDMYAHAFGVMAGSGTAGADDPYLIAYWNNNEGQDTPLAERCCAMYIKFPYGTNVTTFAPQKVKVCNTAYTYYSMLYGDSFAKKFQEGDYLKLIAHGIKATGEVTTTEFYLANCTGPEDTWFVTSWTDWNLISLGEIDGLYFTMESSDTGQFGINTPTYFALDDFVVRSYTALY